MRLYLEPIFAYNEFEQELQYLELSTLIVDDKGETIRHNTLTFPPMFGIDQTLLTWIGRNEKVVGETNQQEELKNEFKEINEIITQDTLVLSWNDIFMQLEDIHSPKRISVYHVTGKKTNLEITYSNITGMNLNSRKSMDRLLATKLVYEHYRDTQHSLTDEAINVTISEDIEL